MTVLHDRIGHYHEFPLDAELVFRSLKRRKDGKVDERTRLAKLMNMWAEHQMKRALVAFNRGELERGFRLQSLEEWRRTTWALALCMVKV